MIKAFILVACFLAINSEPINRATPKLADLTRINHGNGNIENMDIQKISNFFNGQQQQQQQQNETLSRAKRQNVFAGGFGIGYGAYDYNDYYGDYVSDYAYDYYDWVCSGATRATTVCQLCNILTSQCCNPALPPNNPDPLCTLPDSCLNNPCLSGGTCITTATLDGRADFICVCLPGLTGKYCQVWTDYFVGADVLPAAVPLIEPIMPPQPVYVQPILPPPPPPAPAPLQYQQYTPQYAPQAPAPVQYAPQAPVQQYAPQEPAPVQQYAPQAPAQVQQYAPQEPAPVQQYAPQAPAPVQQYAPQEPAPTGYGYGAGVQQQQQSLDGRFPGNVRMMSAKGKQTDLIDEDN